MEIFPGLDGAFNLNDLCSSSVIAAAVFSGSIRVPVMEPPPQNISGMEPAGYCEF
jgi:hypothetical protein